MAPNGVIRWYLLLLVAHVAHVFEEIWGRFWLIERVFGLGGFLIANTLIFSVPIAIFYFVLQERRGAYVAAMLYAALMILNGAAHNLATLVTGRYLDGFAGGFTGLGLIVIGVMLILQLRRAMTVGKETA